MMARTPVAPGPVAGVLVPALGGQGLVRAELERELTSGLERLDHEHLRARRMGDRDQLQAHLPGAEDDRVVAGAD